MVLDVLNLRLIISGMSYLIISNVFIPSSSLFKPDFRIIYYVSIEWYVRALIAFAVGNLSLLSLFLQFISMQCLLPAGCREAANCRYCFNSQATNQVFRPARATRCTDSGQTLHTDGHRGPLGCAKFHVNRCRRVGMRPPKYQKFPLFGKESPRRGDSLDRFQKFLGAFICLTILR